MFSISFLRKRFSTQLFPAAPFHFPCLVVIVFLPLYCQLYCHHYNITIVYVNPGNGRMRSFLNLKKTYKTIQVINPGHISKNNTMGQFSTFLFLSLATRYAHRQLQITEVRKTFSSLNGSWVKTPHLIK